MHEEPLTVKQAAVPLGVTTRTVRLWIESGRLAAERIEGKYGPEWRLDPAEVRLAADRRAERPVALDLAGKPGGNDLRALASVLTSEIRKIQESQIEHARYVQDLSQRIDSLTLALPPATDDAALQGLIRQGAQVQQTVEEESRTHHREAQELQAALQTLSAALQEQTEQVTLLSEELTSLRARPTPWYRRLFG